MTTVSASSSPAPSAGMVRLQWVVCLCAAWCGTCRDYRPVFDALALRYPDMRFVWADVEDEAHGMGDLDVETFPTLLIASEDRPLFLGALLPHSGVLERLLQNLAEGATPTVEPVAQEVLTYIRQTRSAADTAE